MRYQWYRLHDGFDRFIAWFWTTPGIVSNMLKDIEGALDIEIDLSGEIGKWGWRPVFPTYFVPVSDEPWAVQHGRRGPFLGWVWARNRGYPNLDVGSPLRYGYKIYNSQGALLYR